MADLVQMSDQFQGLPMDVLIGGPLTAACDSQIKLARATADFIKVIGFLPPTDGEKELHPRTAAFRFKRPVEDEAPTDAVGRHSEIGTQEVEMEVPLLAIVNIPNLSITAVDVTFDMEVKSSFSATQTSEQEGSLSAEAKIGWGPFSAKVQVQGKVSAHQENIRKSDNSAKYHVSVHAEDRGMPEGLARVMDILQTSVAPMRISDSSTSKRLPE